MADVGEPATQVVASAPRSAAVGRDVIGAIITGDVDQLFLGPYARLRDLYLSPRETFARHDPGRFVGRKWLSNQVDEFLARERCGYFVLEADAGLGKSAFLTELVRTRHYIHHFVRPGPASRVDTALRSLAAQLVRVTDSDPYLLADLDASVLFSKVLAEAAARLKPGKQLVLVVDGLDEADTPPGCNPLGLPAVLPTGVFCLVAHRPGVVWADIEPRVLYQLRADNDRNLADMDVFLRRAAAWDVIAAELAVAGYSADRFVATLADKCQGVWIYLHYVVDEIDRGTRSPLDLDSLPRGVWQYYAQFWNRWRNEHAETWDTEYLPLLATLGAVQEPATLPLLCMLADLSPHPRLRRLLKESWRPFLTVVDDEDTRYGVNHSSLREFLTGQLAPNERDQLTDAERCQLQELVEATRRAHRRIADGYLTRWGGLENDLPNLVDPHRNIEDAGYDARYGVRHLTSHLNAAGRADDLHRLLACQSTPPAAGPDSAPRRVNVWYTAHDQTGDLAGYLRDIQMAWQLAQSVAFPGSSAHVLRYGLITASLRSMAGNLPSKLLRALVRKRVWSSREALVHLQAMPDVSVRAQRLAEFLPVLTGPTFTDAIDLLVALGRVDSGREEDHVHELLTTLSPDQLCELPDDAFVHLLTRLGSGSALQAVYESLCARLPPDQLPRLLQLLALVPPSGPSRPRLLRLCAGRAGPDVTEEFVDKVRRGELDNHRKVLILAPLVPLLASEHRQCELADQLATWLRDGQWCLSDIASTVGYLALVRPGLRLHPRVLLGERAASLLTKPFATAVMERVAAEVAADYNDDNGSRDHLQQALEALRVSARTPLHDSYWCGVELRELIRLAQSDTDTSTCLKLMPDLHLSIISQCLRELAPRLTADQVACIIRWATSTEDVNVEAIEAVAPRLSKEQMAGLLLAPPPGAPDAGIMRLRRVLLAQADEQLIGRFLEQLDPWVVHMGSSTPKGPTRLDREAAQNLEAVCRSPGASAEQVEACLEIALSAVTRPEDGRVAASLVLAAGLPRVPHLLGTVIDRIGLPTIHYLYRAQLVEAVNQVLPEQYLGAVLDAARADPNRERIVDAIADRLSPEGLLDAVSICRPIRDGWMWNSAVVALSRSASASGRRCVPIYTDPFRSSFHDNQSSLAAARVPADSLLGCDLQPESPPVTGRSYRGVPSHLFLSKLSQLLKEGSSSHPEDEEQLVVPSTGGGVGVPETEAERIDKLLAVVDEGRGSNVTTKLIEALAAGLGPVAANRALDVLGKPEETCSSGSRSHQDGLSANRAKVVVFARYKLALQLDESDRDAVIDQLVQHLESLVEAGFGHWVGEQLLDIVPYLTTRSRHTAQRMASRAQSWLPSIGPVWSAAIQLQLAITASSKEEATRHLGNAVDYARTLGSQHRSLLLCQAANLSDSPEASSKLFVEALDAAGAVSTHGNSGVRALLDMLEFEPLGELRGRVMLEAVLSYQRTHFGADGQLHRLVSRLTALEARECDLLIVELVGRLRMKHREELLSRLEIVAPGIGRVLGSTWADNVLLALTQVYSWWP